MKKLKTFDEVNEGISNITNKEIKEFDDSIHDINAGIVRLKKLLKKNSVASNFKEVMSALDKAVADVDKFGKDIY
jgi:hypothetical protein